MVAEQAVQRIAIVGAGRFGRALALRLRDRFQVALADREPRLTKQFTKRHGLRFRYPHEIGAEADLIAVCVPPPAVVEVLRGLVHQRPPGLCVSMATSVPTSRLLAHPELGALRIAGLKPVGQFTAIAHRVPVLFVTGSREHHPLLRLVFGGLGEVLLGDEDAVGEINHTATAYALRACDALWPVLTGLAGDERVVRAAVRGVFAGTALDYPPGADNAYINTVRATLANGGGDRP